MKRIVFSVLLLIFVASANAQYAGNYGFRLGLTAHPTFGWVKQENANSVGFDLGFSYGLMGDFNFAENYAFNTGLTITTINGKIEELLIPQGTVHIKYKLQYIEVPLAIKLKTSKQGKIRGFGQFGLSNGFNISAKMDQPNQPKNADIKSSTNFYRAGLIIGGGAEFDIDQHTSLVGGLTFNNGFTNFGDFNGNKLRNHYVALNIGIFF